MGHSGLTSKQRYNNYTTHTDIIITPIYGSDDVNNDLIWKKTTEVF